ncbi:MAG: hypothetical protein H0X65_15630 [Gemmatimonadetes bacterium]|nr:hypothetical protein [Gemmatimonadota bacterium]
MDVRRVAGKSRDALAQGGMGSQHAAVAVPVDAWSRSCGTSTETSRTLPLIWAGCP